MSYQKEILTGWKEIEKYVGLNRETILQHGYPVRKVGQTAIAIREELLAHILSMPVISQNIAEFRKKTT